MTLHLSTLRWATLYRSLIKYIYSYIYIHIYKGSNSCHVNDGDYEQTNEQLYNYTKDCFSRMSSSTMNKRLRYWSYRNRWMHFFSNGGISSLLVQYQINNESTVWYIDIFAPIGLSSSSLIKLCSMHDGDRNVKILCIMQKALHWADHAFSRRYIWHFLLKILEMLVSPWAAHYWYQITPAPNKEKPFLEEVEDNRGRV